jgi:hypothetical protein
MDRFQDGNGRLTAALPSGWAGGCRRARRDAVAFRPLLPAAAGLSPAAVVPGRVFFCLALLTRRARNASGTATQCTRINDSRSLALLWLLPGASLPRRFERLRCRAHLCQAAATTATRQQHRSTHSTQAPRLPSAPPTHPERRACTTPAIATPVCQSVRASICQSVRASICQSVRASRGPPSHAP